MRTLAALWKRVEFWPASKSKALSSKFNSKSTQLSRSKTHWHSYKDRKLCHFKSANKSLPYIPSQESRVQAVCYQPTPPSTTCSSTTRTSASTCSKTSRSPRSGSTTSTSRIWASTRLTCRSPTSKSSSWSPAWVPWTTTGSYSPWT